VSNRHFFLQNAPNLSASARLDKASMADYTEGRRKQPLEGFMERQKEKTEIKISGNDVRHVRQGCGEIAEPVARRKESQVNLGKETATVEYDPDKVKLV